MKIAYCKSRVFRMHFIFVYFVHGGFRTKIKCILKIESKSENPQRPAAERKFHAYERSGVPRIRKFNAYIIFWIYSKKIKRKSWSNSPPKLLACMGFLYKVVHKIGCLRKFNRSRKIEFKRGGRANGAYANMAAKYGEQCKRPPTDGNSPFLT